MTHHVPMDMKRHTRKAADGNLIFCLMLIIYPAFLASWRSFDFESVLLKC